ncbi:hypothetical protein [Thermophilibacter mediterraneus]|uniref:hypothetical protein n=1 Tax=Thermophilibacter mediterraneus TaxID=1871031 RepID=UPI002353C1A5|nr:hypothetical protein [Thermophilibacter mediterraneus]
MSELSLFLDESGSDNLRDTYYILALVVHEQSDDLGENIARYQAARSSLSPTIDASIVTVDAPRRW